MWIAYFGERPMLYSVDLQGITYLVETDNKEKNTNEASVSFVLLAQATKGAFSKEVLRSSNVFWNAHWKVQTIFHLDAMRRDFFGHFHDMLSKVIPIENIRPCITFSLNTFSPHPNEMLSSFNILLKWVSKLDQGLCSLPSATIYPKNNPTDIRSTYSVNSVRVSRAAWKTLKISPFDPMTDGRMFGQLENLITGEINLLNKLKSGRCFEKLIQPTQPPARRQLFPTSDAQVSNTNGSTLAVVNVQPPPDKTSHYSERKPINKSNTPKNTEETQPQESRLLRTAVQTQERLTGVQAKIITVQAGVILKLSQDLDAHEERLMAVERELIAQNELVVDQGNQIASLRRTVEQQQSQLETLMGANALIMFSSHHEPETDPNNNNHYSVDPKKRKATDQEGEEGTHSKISFYM